MTALKASGKPIYFALVHPHLNYGIIAWENTDKGIIKQTNILQKRAIRIINNLFYLCMITDVGNYQIHFMEIIR